MITATDLEKAMNTKLNAEAEVYYQMKDATFVFVGIDSEFVYFNVVAKQSQVSAEQKTSICEKTRFQLIKDCSNNRIFKLEMKVSIR